MARISGIDIPKEKRGVVSLTYIYGIGSSRAKMILDSANVSPDKKVSEWSDDDTAKVRSGRYRPIFRYFYVLFVIDCLILGYLGAQVPEGIYLFLSRVTTIYYFAYFLLVLPILGRIEKMKPMPIGISNSELSRDMVAAE